MRVSVVMPIFNKERYLVDAVESVLAQSMPDFELVLVDDKSPDHALEIARSYASNDARIRLIERERNGGAAEAFDTGARAARGRYVARIAGDDVYYPDALRLMADRLDAEPDAIIAYCNMNQINENGEVLYPLTVNPPETCLFPRNRTGICFMWRREVLDMIGGFSSGCYAEDYDFLLRASLHGRFVKVEGPPQLGFRLNGTQLSCRHKEVTLGSINAHLRYWRTVIQRRPLSVYAWWKLAASGLRYASVFIRPEAQGAATK